MQTRLHSFIETSTNIVSGMVIAFVISQLAHIYSTEIQTYIWAGFEWKVGAGSNAIMTMILTFVSFCRSYTCRRYFNKRGQK